MAVSEDLGNYLYGVKRNTCQEKGAERTAKRTDLKISLLLSLSVACLLAVPALAKKDKSTTATTSKAVDSTKVAAAPELRVQSDQVITPPGEMQYFPIRVDGQPFVLNVDRTVNMTRSLNQLYFDPRWRGEVWTPFDQIDTIERATIDMGTWPEYDSANIFRVGTGVSKWFEKYSGFGP